MLELGFDPSVPSVTAAQPAERAALRGVGRVGRVQSRRILRIPRGRALIETRDPVYQRHAAELVLSRLLNCHNAAGGSRGGGEAAHRGGRANGRRSRSIGRGARRYRRSATGELSRSAGVRNRNQGLRPRRFAEPLDLPASRTSRSSDASPAL